MRKEWPRFAGLVLLILLYLLVQFAFPALGDNSLGIERHRTLFTAWLFMGIILSGAGFTGLKSSGGRFLAGAATGLLAVLLIPVWSAHGCWSPDLTSGLLTGTLALVGGGLAACYAPAAYTHAASSRRYLPAVVAAVLIAGFAVTALLILPSFPRSKVTIYGKTGPQEAFRRVDTASILFELRPKPWARGGRYGGPVGLGTDSIVQVVSDGGVRGFDLAGRLLPAPALTPPSHVNDTWFPPKVAGDLMLLRRSSQQWPSLVNISGARVLATTAPADWQIRAAACTESGAYIVDWDTIRAWGTDGSELWSYRRQPADITDLRFRDEATLTYHPGNRFSPWDSSCLCITPQGPVAELRSEVVALTADGRVRWRSAASGAVLAALASTDGTFVATLEMIPSGDQAGTAVGAVRGFDGLTGAQLFRWDVPDDIVCLGWATDGASLLLSLDRRGGDNMTGEFVALSRQGEMLWRQQKGTAELGSLITGIKPVSGGFLVTGSWEAVLLDGLTGRARFTLPSGLQGQIGFDYNAGPLIWHDAIVFAVGRQVRAYDVNNGAELWEYYEPYGVVAISAMGDNLAVGSPRGVALLQWSGPCPT